MLRAVFGDARMEPLADYARRRDRGRLDVDIETETSPPTPARPSTAGGPTPTAHRDEVTASLGAESLEQFVRSCDILAGFWDDGTLGYGLVAAAKPGQAALSR